MTADLPLKALPELSNLLDTLKQTLTQEMAKYTENKDTKNFQHVLNALGYDLTEYNKSIDAWYTLPLTPEEHDAVQAIGLNIDEARHLLTKAIGMIKL